jgi:hypothetical protein
MFISPLPPRGARGNSVKTLKEMGVLCVYTGARRTQMGYMIHFDEDIVGTDELKLIETKKAILEKLRVRFGFEYVPNSQALAAAQAPTPKRLLSRAPQPG